MTQHNQLMLSSNCDMLGSRFHMIYTDTDSDNTFIVINAHGYVHILQYVTT